MTTLEKRVQTAPDYHPSMGDMGYVRQGAWCDVGQHVATYFDSLQRMCVECSQAVQRGEMQEQLQASTTRAITKAFTQCIHTLCTTDQADQVEMDKLVVKMIEIVKEKKHI